MIRSKHAMSAGVSASTNLYPLRQARTPLAGAMTGERAHCAHSLQVGSFTAISDGQAQLHHEQTVEALYGASLGLALHGLHRHSNRKFAGAEMHGLRLADTDKQEDEAREIRIFTRMRGDMFGLLHASLVRAV